jgi:hypothetical protein
MNYNLPSSAFTRDSFSNTDNEDTAL